MLMVSGDHLGEHWRDTDLFLRSMVSGDHFGVREVLLCYGSVSSPVLSGSGVIQRRQTLLC